MPNHANRFVWYDLMTTDAAAAQQFYEKVVGWKVQDPGMGPGGYMMLVGERGPVGGVMQMPQEARVAGRQPMWLGHIGVDDVDGFAERVEQAGGSVQRAPEEIPEVGRFAVVADPDGATFLLFAAKTGEPPQEEPGQPGTIGWRELHAANSEGAWAFYSGLFGWEKGDAIPMGPAGSYQIFTIHGVPAGGIMPKPPVAHAAGWLYYITVPVLAEAMGRVTDAGGTIVTGPMEVAGGGIIAQCTDPQGVAFALVSRPEPPKAEAAA